MNKNKLMVILFVIIMLINFTVSALKFRSDFVKIQAHRVIPIDMFDTE